MKSVNDVPPAGSRPMVVSESFACPDTWMEWMTISMPYASSVREAPARTLA